MTKDQINRMRPADDAARSLARTLIHGARTAALAVIDPDDGSPYVSRIAFGRGPDGRCFTLISDLAIHARALRAEPRASLLIGEPGPKGDPLNHPRLTLRVKADVIDDAIESEKVRSIWLGLHPKSKLYVDFADFHFFGLRIEYGHLNAGFGRAYSLGKKDLTV